MCIKKKEKEKIKSTIYLLHNECADVHTHNAEVRADTPRRCVVVFNNVSFERQQSASHHHQKPNDKKPFLLEERDDGAAPSSHYWIVFVTPVCAGEIRRISSLLCEEYYYYSGSSSAVDDDDERAVVERARGRKAHRQRADATNTASREREEDGGDEGDQRSVVANPIVIAAGRRGL